MKRVTAGRPGRAARLWAILAVVASALPAGGAQVQAYQNTVEWGRMVSFWQGLLDHSCGAVYSPERFKALAPDLDRVDAGLTALASAKLLGRETAGQLRGVFHSRCEYVGSHCYPASTQANQSALEAAASASHWVMEMQLDLLRRQSRAGSLEAKLREAIRVNLERELSFQVGLAELEAQQAEQRSALAKQEEQKQKVDWPAFEGQCARQRQALLTSYQDRRLRPSRAVVRLTELVVQLTEAQPPSPGSDSSAAGS